MKVVFETNEVLPKLLQVSSVINSKSSIAILGDVCIAVNSGSMVLTASDSEVWVTERVDILSSDTTTTFCVYAQDIVRCLSSLKDEVVTMTLEEEKKTLTCNYGSGNISMPYESAEDYPRPVSDMSEANSHILPSKTLLHAIEVTQTAVANDELRPIMNGIHFDFMGNGMRCNACNFLKMVRYTRTLSGMESEHAWFTLPKKPASILTSVLSSFEEDVKIQFTDKVVSFSNKHFKITARLLEGNYPDCDRIIPTETRLTVELESAVVLQALKHVLSVDNSNNLVVFTFNGDDLTIEAEDINFGRSAKELIKCKNNTIDEFSICLSGTVVAEMLKNIDDNNVVFEMSEPRKPVVLYAMHSASKDEYLSLIMPMVKNPVAQPQQ